MTRISESATKVYELVSQEEQARLADKLVASLEGEERQVAPYVHRSGCVVFDRRRDGSLDITIQIQVPNCQEASLLLSEALAIVGKEGDWRPIGSKA